MNKSIKHSIALCALVPIVALGADTWWNATTVGDWEDAGNWGAGVPTASLRALINNAADVVTINNPGAVAGLVNMNLGGKLIVASGGSLSIADLRSATGTGHDRIDIHGTLTHTGINPIPGVGNGWIFMGDGNSGASATVTITVKPGGAFASNAGEFLITGAGASLIVDGGTFSKSGWVHLGADGGNGSITVTNGGQLNVDVVTTAPNGTAVITIDGGASTIGTLGWGNGGTGSQTLNMNGGQLTLSTLIDGVGNSFNINGGELIFSGPSAAAVDAMVSGPDWSFAESKLVVENGNGTISVTSGAVQAPTIISSSISNQLMKIVVHAPSGAEKYYPVVNSNLLSGVWGNIPHSDNGANSFVVTNLSYSTAEGTNEVIYLQLDIAEKFFKIYGN